MFRTFHLIPSNSTVCRTDIVPSDAAYLSQGHVHGHYPNLNALYSYMEAHLKLFFLNMKINFSLVGPNLNLANLLTARELTSKVSKQVSITASKLATFKQFQPLSEVVEYSINIYLQLSIPSKVCI